MRCARRLIPSATLVLAGVSAAQESGSPGIEAAMRDAERYAACSMKNDSSCLQALTDSQLLIEVGMAPENFGSRMPNLRYMGGSPYETVNFELARPWGPFTSGDRLVRIVPYFDLAIDGLRGRRSEQVGYLIASSYDSGQSWRFVKVAEVTASLVDWMSRLMPGAAEPQWPEVADRIVREPRFERTSSIRTTARNLIMVDDGFAYAMKWAIRREFEGALTLTIYYDNPGDRSQRLRFRGSLEPGQQELEWRSPVLTGFEAGETYDVVLEASDPDAGKLLFEHRQSLLFRPVLEEWRTEMSQPPPSVPDAAPGP